MNAIFEATIQVLLNDGLLRLSTTRVAHRAGVSVGTLYQYFPNKQALLFATLERHIAMLADAVEKACDENRRAPLETIAAAVVRAYLQAKMTQAQVSPALHRIALELNARELIELAAGRSERAIEATLSTASDGSFSNARVIALTISTALYGMVPPFCERIMRPADSREAEKQLTIMVRSYLVAALSTYEFPG
ncbi:TetR/AcrR family transcriptional regulator [Bradyrhizobium liaoningense]|uniref:TetR/AcrR family transcriptional regulator n=1 Tax=Bradyrhizobium liaoningense TaxID=43992 RepID=UPI0032DEF640